MTHLLPIWIVGTSIAFIELWLEKNNVEYEREITEIDGIKIYWLYSCL